MHTLRTRIKKDIVCEFVVSKKRSNKVIILCGGMPGYTSKREMLFWLSRRGYWAFLPRYRGTWESGGSFLKISPHQDVLDLIDQLPKGFKDLWSGKTLKITKPQIYIIGGSFGGPAAILASKDRRVKKVAVISPVIDWRVESKVEPLGWMEKFTKMAFGEGYRFTHANWQKLKTGKFYNPITEIKKLDKNKILIFHAQDDKIVYLKPSKEFSEKLGCEFIALKKGGHMSLSNAIRPEFWKKIKKFFNNPL
jgi:alpha-beta hydrolase superfamily lysophospholipase